jgi:hypothetical protein
VTNLPTTAEELGDLAQKGAIALVGAMATGAFGAARAGIARLFARRGPDHDRSIRTQLDGDDDLVADADAAERDTVREELAPAWRRRLVRLLTEHPDAEQQLRALLTELEGALPEERQHWVLNVVARDHGRVYAAQGGNVVHHDLADKRMPLPPGESR